jgi:hypothetical protein
LYFIVNQEKKSQKFIGKRTKLLMQKPSQNFVFEKKITVDQPNPTFVT